MKNRDSAGRYIQGKNGVQAEPVGAVRIRTRHKRGGEKRAFVKVAEPNVWVLRSKYVWESSMGIIPAGMVIHHKDGDKMNDALDNLVLVSKAEHLAFHREAYKEKIVKKLVGLRRDRWWSTKSKTKRTGHPPTWDSGRLLKALGTYIVSDRTVEDVASEFGIPKNTFWRKLRAIKDALGIRD